MATPSTGKRPRRRSAVSGEMSRRLSANVASEDSIADEEDSIADEEEEEASLVNSDEDAVELAMMDDDEPLPPQEKEMDVEEEVRPPPKEAPYRVVIVGAGLAGLGCARELRRLGASVAVVEAKQRIGGRCLSTLSGDDGRCDLGAGWIHGVRKNPIYELAASFGLHPCDTGDDVDLRKDGGIRLSGTDDDHRAEKRFNDVLTAARSQSEDKAASDAQQQSPGEKKAGVYHRHGVGLSLGVLAQESPAFLAPWASDDEKKLFRWHERHLEYANATTLRSLSARHWDQDDVAAFDGAHAVLREGFGAVAAKLAEDVGSRFIMLGFDVAKIQAESDGVGVQARDGRVVRADAVVCTVPLGVLKAGGLVLPDLPKWKHRAIDRVGFGILDKIAVRFRKGTPLLGRAPMMGRVDTDGTFFLFVDLQAAAGSPIVVALTPADAAENLRKGKSPTGDDAVRTADPTMVTACVRALGRVLGLAKPAVDEALASVVAADVTSWRDDPRTRGSYAYLPPQATPHDIDALAEPVGPRRQIRFAGEATSRTHLATAAGAYLSGVAEARKLARSQGFLPIKDVADGGLDYDDLDDDDSDDDLGEEMKNGKKNNKKAEEYRKKRRQRRRRLIVEAFVAKEHARRNRVEEKDMYRPLYECLGDPESVASVVETEGLALDPGVRRRRRERYDRLLARRSFDAEESLRRLEVDPVPTCALCGGTAFDDASIDDANTGGRFVAGELLAFHRGSKIFWVHEGCASSSPDVAVVDDSEFFNLENAIRRGRQLKCTACGLPGATLGCTSMACFKSYHPRCAAIDCQWDFTKWAPAEVTPAEETDDRILSDSDDDSDDDPDPVPFTCLEHRQRPRTRPLRPRHAGPAYRRKPPRRPAAVSRSLLRNGLSWEDHAALLQRKAPTVGGGPTVIFRPRHKALLFSTDSSSPHLDEMSPPDSITSNQ